MKCRACKQLLVNPHRRPFEVWCSPDCAVAIWRAKEAKKQAQETRKQREKLKTPSQRANEAQTAVNKYVRLRDYALGCVSCDRGPSWGGQWHASHFRSVGAASAIRFHLWGINKSCSICNNHKSGNISEYEPRLILKIGKDKVEWLKSQNSIRRYDAEYLSRLKQIFNKRANRLSKRLSHA
jgi:hypothetical protein